MLKWLALLSVGIVIVLLIPGGPIGIGLEGSARSPSPANPMSNPGLAPAVATLPWFSEAPSSSTGPSVSLASFSTAISLPPGFWGVDVTDRSRFSSTDGSNVVATPATFLRFPGGIQGEEINYTSNVLTSIYGGSTSKATTSIQTFVNTCNSIPCQAIIQLPAEIDRPQTAAYYASYIVHTLHFQPAYWEIGNSVPGWTHFDTPWSKWGSTSSTQVTPLLFAQELGKYITAIKAVDSGAHFIALGMAMGWVTNLQKYITEVASLDGKQISGVSVHSYAMGPAPSNPTWAELLATLSGQYSLTSGIDLARSYLKSGCSTCNLQVFVTEANAAEVNSFTKLLPTFASTLYVTADACQALNLRLSNLDWFAYASSYKGAWLQGSTFGQQYKLMTQMMTHLGPKTVATTVSGPSTLFAAGTYGSSGLALLLVNTNTTHSVSVSLAKAGILSGALVHNEQWRNGSNGPTNSSFTFGGSVTLPALSITILTVASTGLLAPAAPTTSSAAFDLASTSQPTMKNPGQARTSETPLGAPPGALPPPLSTPGPIGPAKGTAPLASNFQTTDQVLGGSA